MWRALIALLLFAGTAQATPPRVVTSIAPLQGLVTDVMAGVATPQVLLATNTSPHDFALRPSQLRALGRADVVFYIGLDMEPWLIKPLSQAPAVSIALGQSASPRKLAIRDLRNFANGHRVPQPGAAIDPHVWLSPDNALLWLDIIAGVLAKRDPDNAATYMANAETQRLKTFAAITAAQRTLAPLANVDLIVTHDSMQYFEDAFGLTVSGAFSATDGRKAGARSTARLLSSLDANACVVEDTGEPSAVLSRLPATVRIAKIEPLGLDLLGRPDYYPRLLTSLSAALSACAP